MGFLTYVNFIHSNPNCIFHMEITKNEKTDNVKKCNTKNKIL